MPLSLSSTSPLSVCFCSLSFCARKKSPHINFKRQRNRCGCEPAKLKACISGSLRLKDISNQQLASASEIWAAKLDTKTQSLEHRARDTYTSAFPLRSLCGHSPTHFPAQRWQSQRHHTINRLRREAWKEEALGDLPWKDERRPSSTRRTLELWETFESRGGAHMGFSERIDIILSWTGNWPGHAVIIGSR